MTDVRPSIRPSVDDAAERWVSFTDLAAQRGISRAAASKLVRRHGWRRQTDNQGRVLILVPVTALDRLTVRPTSSDDDIADRPTDAPGMAQLAAGALAALEDAVSGLREQLDVANARAERAEAAIADAASDVRELRAHATALQVELADRQAALERTQGEAAALRERVDELQAGQELMMDMHARALAGERSRADRAEAGREEERSRADRTEAGREATGRHADEERARADRAEVEREAADRRADALQARLELAEAARQQAAQAEEERRKAEVERKGRGLLARLRAAVRGE